MRLHLKSLTCGTLDYCRIVRLYTEIDLKLYLSEGLLNQNQVNWLNRVLGNKYERALSVRGTVPPRTNALLGISAVFINRSNFLY